MEVLVQFIHFIWFMWFDELHMVSLLNHLGWIHMPIHLSYVFILASYLYMDGIHMR